MKKANHIILNNKTILDLRQDSVAPESLLTGATAHDKSGQSIEGIAISPTGEITIVANGSYDVANYAVAAINVPGEVINTYQGAVTIKIDLDPMYNHFGSNFPGWFEASKDGEWVDIQEMPDDFSGFDYIYYIHDGLHYFYNEETNDWNLGGSDMPWGGSDMIVLDTIGYLPVTSITQVFDPLSFESSFSHASIGTSVKNITDYAFYTREANLSTITYRGTMAQWNAITFDETWNAECDEITVNCVDGTIIVPASTVEGEGWWAP